jgi:hypothetical protein
MDREAGSFIEDEQGNIVPNMKDEAMAIRARQIKPEKEVKADVKDESSSISES